MARSKRAKDVAGLLNSDLRQLANSLAARYPNATIVQRVAKLAEEVGELSKAVNTVIDPDGLPKVDWRLLRRFMRCCLMAGFERCESVRSPIPMPNVEGSR